MADSRELEAGAREEHWFGTDIAMTDLTSRAFDSKAVGSIIQAYDAVLGSLRGSIFASPFRAIETRAKVVQSIIETAENGERDPTKLRDAALRRFGM